MSTPWLSPTLPDATGLPKHHLLSALSSRPWPTCLPEFGGVIHGPWWKHRAQIHKQGGSMDLPWDDGQRKALACLSVLGEFWRLRAAMERWGGSGGRLRARSVPMLPGDFEVTLQVLGADGRADEDLRRGLRLGRFRRAPRQAQPNAHELPTAFPQEWLGVGVGLLLEQCEGGLITKSAHGYEFALERSSLAGQVEKWFGPTYRAHWLATNLERSMPHDAVCRRPPRL